MLQGLEPLDVTRHSRRHCNSTTHTLPAYLRTFVPGYACLGRAESVLMSGTECVLISTSPSLFEASRGRQA